MSVFYNIENLSSPEDQIMHPEQTRWRVGDEIFDNREKAMRYTDWKNGTAKHVVYLDDDDEPAVSVQRGASRRPIPKTDAIPAASAVGLRPITRGASDAVSSPPANADALNDSDKAGTEAEGCSL